MPLDKDKSIFFCGLGGSGMMPLALILLARGFDVHGSDRAYDQNQTPEKFKKLQNLGIRLMPQDGSGLTKDTGVLVVSSAIEESVPDVKSAREYRILIRKRSDVLSELFHLSNCSIGVSGTSGKTTTTGMLSTILQECNLIPTMMNGGRVKNFEEKKHTSMGSLLVGGANYFVSEMDESDGSIDLFTPDIAVLNNIELDHVSLDQLKSHFQNFINRAQRGCVLNLDNDNVRDLIPPSHSVTYGIEHEGTTLAATDLRPRPDGINFQVNGRPVCLKVPGRHNVSNALAALSVAHILNLDQDKSIRALEHFTGIKRRLETIGITESGVIIIDDFAHNPDKISASLATLKEFDGRLIVMFQPHGFAPLRLMGQEMADVFNDYLGEEDILCVPEVYYAGGTVDRSVTSKDFVEMIHNAQWFSTREESGIFIKDTMHSGDRVVIMGARDDSLTVFAEAFLCRGR